MIAGIRKTKQGLRIGTNNVPIVLHAGNVTAAGSVIGNAVALPYTVNNVAAADNTKCVILPTPAVAGQVVYVYNSVATNGLPVFPHVGGAINGGTANATVVIEGKTLAKFISQNTTSWAAQFTANT
jgi:hypothetical protein